jgi:hypothetical protein
MSTISEALPGTPDINRREPKNLFGPSLQLQVGLFFVTSVIGKRVLDIYAGKQLT